MVHSTGPLRGIEPRRFRLVLRLVLRLSSLRMLGLILFLQQHMDLKSSTALLCDKTRGELASVFPAKAKPRSHGRLRKGKKRPF